MPKWDYLYLVKYRWFEKTESSQIKQGSDWEFKLFTKGSKHGKKWNGENPCDLFCELGEEGWELVSCTPRSDYLGSFLRIGDANSIAADYAGFTSAIEYMFKRPRE